MSEKEKQREKEPPKQEKTNQLSNQIRKMESTVLQKTRKIEELDQKLNQYSSLVDQEVARRKKAEEELERREIQARLIHEVSQRVSSELQLEELFSAVVTAIYDAFGYYSIVLATVDEKAQRLVMRSSAGGFRDIFPPGGYIPVGDGMTGHTAATGEIQISGNVQDNPHYRRYADEETCSELVVPIKSGEKNIGVLDLQSTEFNAFDQTDVMLMETIADQVAVAMDNARLYEQAQSEIRVRKKTENELKKHHENLEDRVNDRTAELQASEERYRSLFDGIPIGLYRTTPEGRILDANLALVDLFGAPNREELLATNLNLTYVDPKERLRWQGLMERKGVVRDFETWIIRYDGSKIWVNDTARVVKDDQGNVLYYEGSFEDITDRKLAQEQLLQYHEQLEELVKERTAELQASEERYRTLFDGVPMGLYRTTPDGQVLEFNHAMMELLGYPNKEEALKATTTEEYVNLEDRIHWQELMEKEGVVRDFEAQVRRHDDEIIWVSDTARVVKDEQGQTLYYEGSLEDITERKKFEEEIRRQKDYFESLFVNSPVAIVTADLDAKVVSWNPKAEQLFGYSQKEAVGRHVDDLVANHPSVREEADSLTAQIDELGRVQASTKRTRKDGSFVDVDLLALPLVLAGEKVGFYALYHDISELKRVERELRQQKDYFESLFINSPVAVMTGDLEANLVSWNPMAEKLFGYTEAEVIGKHIDDLLATDPAIREEAQAYTRELLTTDRIHRTGKRNRKDGSLVDVEISVLPVFVADEKVGYIAIYFDISELLQARREAEAANQAKSIFLANMSHELRTPLNAILGFSQLMEGNPNLTTDQQENLRIINQSGEHLLALINDVLEMSKIEAGQIRLRKQTFDLKYMLNSLEEMFTFQAETKGLRLSFELAENIPQYVTSDEGKLRQVLNNLIGNAIKFTDEGSVRVLAASTPQEREQLELHFDVLDTGPGIPVDEIEAVFDPFVQASDTNERTTNRTSEGTGLGLSISRKFVRLMGGEITVQSTLGKGSHFHCSVVVEESKDTKIPELRPGDQAKGLAAGQPTFKLLVVEDRENNRRLLTKLLDQMGFEVQEAQNGKEAVEAWQRWRPHLIWMDMRMPVMDGREATRLIKSMPGGESVSIIALTATAFDEDREQILLEGCDDFVRKPFQKRQIVEILEKHLGVQFTYEGEMPGGDLEPGPGVGMRKGEIQSITQLPADLLEEMRQAVLRADYQQILTLIKQVQGTNPEIAVTLTKLAESFQYQKILTLLDNSGDEI